MIRIGRLEITKAQLAAVPRDERALMLPAGHTLDTLGVWIKLIRFSTNRAAANLVEARISEAQSQIIFQPLFRVPAKRGSQRSVGRMYLLMVIQGRSAVNRVCVMPARGQPSGVQASRRPPTQPMQFQ